MESSRRQPASPDATGARPALTPHGQAQRQALVDAAYQVIAEGGFEHLRTRDVAARANVNIATLHYYFATKEDLIRAVLDRVRDEFQTIHAPPGLGSDLTPLEMLRNELLDIPYHLEHSPQTYYVVFELGLRALRDPAIHAVMLEMDREWRTYIESILGEGVRQGTFPADMDIATIAAALIAFVKGASLQIMMARDAFDAQRLLQEADKLLAGAQQRPASPA